MTQTTSDALRIAVVGAGPAGLALALLAAQRLPRALVSVFDARPADKDVAADARTLALSLGSVQLLERLHAWPRAVAQDITEVHVSQSAPSWTPFGGDAPAVHIRAADLRVPRLGAVLSYGSLVAPLQQAWLQACAAQPTQRRMRFATPVAALKPLADGVEVDAGIVEAFDLAVVAEGGVFAEQSRKALSHDYRQRAWVGQVTLEGGRSGLAIERFTPSGPLALLPLAAAGSGPTRAALVWCVPADDDPLTALDDTQRRILLGSLLPAEAGTVRTISALKAFDLGLNAELRLVHGRTVRIGNAAQTLHPVAGQGLNLGLRDAYALVQTLRGDGTLDARLRRLEASRALDRWSIIATTDFLARSFTWRAPLVSALRSVALDAVNRLSPVKSQLARQLMFGLR